MKQTSSSLKTAANAQFAASDYTSALSTYDRAVAALPSYLDYELAVLQSNIAACHIRMGQWKEAVESCERALEGLERELPMPNKVKSTARSEDEPAAPKEDAKEDEVVELQDDEDEVAALQKLNISDSRKADVQRIRTKTLLRRARAKSSIEPVTWSNLSGALEDYTLLSTPEYFSKLPPSDQKTVRVGMATLPAKVSEAKEKEVGEMMGKLKELGNGILKPFGLSTDMFKMVQDPKTGGYSMSFGQGEKK